jgi:major vault protein
MAENSINKELILTAGRFAHVVDETNGTVICYVGPTKSSLSPTDRPVIYRPSTGTFDNVGNLDQAIQSFVVIPNGSYAVLANPAKDGNHPPLARRDSIAYDQLRHGEYYVIPGPQSFALWPGQSASVIKGHQLGYNEFLKIRIYDENAARLDWDNGVIKAAKVSQEVIAATTDSTITVSSGATKKAIETQSSILSIDKNSLFTGQILIVKGTEVSFYIPPNGIEVIQDEKEFVRQAVTLERLEYCILLDQSGRKRYVRGPVVVFPSPTETFITRHDSSGNVLRKFKAYELTPISGIHVKVISDYVDGDKEYKEGEELFITGNEQAIYFPREEHALINYGDREIYYAIAIPKGEARYILNRLTGETRLVRGEVSYLPDPRKEVVVQRVLSDLECEMYYPGNSEALAFNRNLRNQSRETSDLGIEYFANTASLDQVYTSCSVSSGSSTAKRGLMGDSLTRPQKYTPPRTITLDSKFLGAVTISPYSGYAVKIIDKSGNRRVVVGPSTELLEYDEKLEVLELSTGKPKNTDKLLKTVYLSTFSNAVTDILTVESADMVSLSLKLKYLVRFSGDSDEWFNISNYVKYLTDHMRSLIATAIRKTNVRDFYSNSLDIIKDIVLGESGEKLFIENNMVIYDVDLLDVRILDDEIDNALRDIPQKLLTLNLELEQKQLENGIRINLEELSRALMNASNESKVLSIDLEYAQKNRTITSESDYVKAKNEVDMYIAEASRDISSIKNQIKEDSVFSTNKCDKLNEEILSLVLDREIKELETRSECSVSMLNSVQPQLIATLQQLADTGLLQQLAPHLAPLAIIKDTSIIGTARALLKDTPLETALNNLERISIPGRTK